MQREEENTSLLHWHTDMEKWMALIQTKDYITQFYWISHCSFDYNSIDECVRVWVCFYWIYRQCTRDDDCIQNNQPYYFHHFIHIAPFYTLYRSNTHLKQLTHFRTGHKSGVLLHYIVFVVSLFIIWALNQMCASFLSFI